MTHSLSSAVDAGIVSPEVVCGLDADAIERLYRSSFKDAEVLVRFRSHKGDHRMLMTIDELYDFAIIGQMFEVVAPDGRRFDEDHIRDILPAVTP
jgi:hypothetical protein